MSYETQVDKSHYFSHEYNHKGRWLSFFYQIKLIVSKKPKNVLEIGPGNGWATRIIKDYGINVDTLDIDSELNPTYVANVDKIPVENSMYDVVCAFEVLEHIPFEKFEENLKEMARVSSKYVIISLPDKRRTLINIWLKIPFVRSLNLFIKIPTFTDHVFDGQHYWEIGKNTYSVNVIKRAIMNAGLILEENFVPFDAPMNHYFVMKKQS